MMIADLSTYILKYAKEYTILSVEKIEYNGQTYDGNSTSRVVRGMLQPIQYEDIQTIVQMGYTTEGKKKFYLPVSEGTLTEGDELVDTDGTHWKILPKLSDYSDLGGFVKYIVHKEMV